MSVSELKTKLHSLIDEVDNEQLLAYINSLLDENNQAQKADWWDELTNEQKKDLEDAEADIDDPNNLIDNDEVFRQAKEWLKK